MVESGYQLEEVQRGEQDRIINENNMIKSVSIYNCMWGKCEKYRGRWEGVRGREGYKLSNTLIGKTGPPYRTGREVNSGEERD